MPETIDFTNRSYFRQDTSFSELATVTVGVTYTLNREPFAELELHDIILPELKLTRQHGKYYDLDEDCGTTTLLL